MLPRQLNAHAVGREREDSHRAEYTDADRYRQYCFLLPIRLNTIQKTCLLDGNATFHC